MPSVPRPAFDLIIGGLWCASAVKVLGYTWQAYSQTWSTMPTASAGSSSQSPSTSSTNTTSDILNTAAKVDKTAGGVVNKVEGPVVSGVKTVDRWDKWIVAHTPGVDKLPKWMTP